MQSSGNGGTDSSRSHPSSASSAGPRVDCGAREGGTRQKRNGWIDSHWGRLLEVACLHPARRSDEANVDQTFQILPQQAEHELRYSEVHSRLDRFLNFLQKDIGYSLLADAKPGRCGAVEVDELIRFPWVDRAKSARVPKKDGIPWCPESGGDHDSKEIHAAAFARKGICGDIWIPSDAVKYAIFPDDLILVSRFARLLGHTRPDVTPKVRHVDFLRTILQGVRLMHLCEFDYGDVVLTLAYASYYFQSTMSEVSQPMTTVEMANVCTLLIFLAHSFILDETCPLRCWQKHIFRKYCTLKVLDTALFRLFRLRGFRLRLTREEELRALSALLMDPVHEETPKLRDVAAVANLRGRFSGNGAAGGKLPNGDSSDRIRNKVSSGCAGSIAHSGRGGNAQEQCQADKIVANRDIVAETGIVTRKCPLEYSRSGGPCCGNSQIPTARPCDSNSEVVSRVVVPGQPMTSCP